MNNNTESLEMSLTKTVNYTLKPFGRFQFNWKNGKRAKRINVMYIGEVDIRHDTTMPLTGEQDKLVVEKMLKHKTDVFVGVGGGWGIKF